jgi:predicted PurR-regulated permease PerM
MERTGMYPRLITLAASVIVIAGLYLAKGVLIPFALAMLVSFLLAPLVLRLQRWHFSRVMAVLTAVLLVFVVSGATSWLVVSQVRDVTTRLSEYKHNIQDKMATLRVVVGKPVQAFTKIVKDLGADLAPAVKPEAAATPTQTVRIAEPDRGPFEVLRDTLGPTFDILMTAAIALVFAFVMLLRRDDLGDRFIRIVGHGQILVTTRALEEAAKKVSSYLWRLLLLNGLHGLAIVIGLTFIGVPNALLWGLLAAILRFIPYVGPWIAASFPVLTALAASTGWSQPLLTVGLLVLLELISNNLLEPWIYGTGTGISPLAILVSALFWTWLWGPVGLVLSTPLTVCLVVMGKYVPQLHFLHLLFGDAPGLSPPARLYQRLIAGDQDQAWVVLRTEIEQKALHELYDSVVLPALSMAEHDRQQGALDKAAEARIEETMKLLLEEAGELRAGSDAGSDSSVAPALADSLRVLCLPAHGTADALAATMLRQVLERDGVQVEVSSIAELAGETLDLLESRRVDIVCISAVPPSRFMHVRYICKRIAGRFPRLPIVAGMWTLDLETQELADRLPILAGVHVVTSLGEARTQVRQLAESVRIQRAAGLAAEVAGFG